jgi:hypothetical protein
MRKKQTKPNTALLQQAYWGESHRAAHQPGEGHRVFPPSAHPGGHGPPGGGGHPAVAAPPPEVPLCSRWAAEAFGFLADEVQRAVLDGQHLRLILLTSRQWGKSVVAALRAIWQAIFFPRSLIVVAGPVEDQACELNLKIYHFLEQLGCKVHGGGRGKLAAYFPNGSRIVGLSEVPDHVRGYSAPALILVDEASFFKGDEILASLMPMLATRPDGAIWLMSTPKQQTGFFYNLWHQEGGPWHRIRVTASEIPDRISPAFLAEEQRRDPLMYRREYCCEFLADDAALFSREALTALLSDEVEPL